MNTSETIVIEGKTYTVRCLSMEEGFPLMDTKTGAMNMPGLVRAATTVDGQPAKEGDISFAVSMQLIPVVMKLNSFSGGSEGNA